MKTPMVITDEQARYPWSPVNISGQSDWVDSEGLEYDICCFPHIDSHRYLSREDFDAKRPVHQYIRAGDRAKINPEWSSAPFHIEIMRQRGSGQLFSVLFETKEWENPCQE